MSRSRRKTLKKSLLQYDPRCHACGRTLSPIAHRDDSAFLIRKRLSCPAHAKPLRIAHKVGEFNAIIALTQKAREFLEREPIPLHQRWCVDGRLYDSQDVAEQTAIDLAKLLGSKVEIFLALTNGATKLAEIVRPGDDARFREESFHHDRRATCDQFRGAK